MADGVSRSTEEEEAVDPALARHWLDHPDEMLAASPLIKQKQR